MKKKYIFWLCIILSNSSLAQKKYFDSMNNALKQIAAEDSEDGWIKFRKTANLNAATIFENNRIAFGLSDNDTMKVNNIFEDEIGMVHYNYIQYYKGFPIDGESVNVHQYVNGEVTAATGNFKKDIQLQTTLTITKTQAIDIALADINAKEYRWQNAFFETELKSSTSKTDTTYYPQPRLVIKEEHGASSGTGIFHLAYRIDIYTSSPFYAQRIYIDAQSGAIIEKYPLQSN